MSLWKPRLLALGLLATGLGAAVALANTLPQSRGALPAAPQPEAGVRVEAPHTEVDVDTERGKVSVRAPYTDVRIDPDKGEVRVRAPYVDLDIRW